MAVTVKAVLLDKHWKEDDTNFYRIRITHKRKSKFIKTNVSCHRLDLNRKGAVINQAVLDSVEDLMRKVRAVINSIDSFDLDAMDIDDVVKNITSELEKPERFRLDFVEFGRSVAAKKSPGNAQTYHVALNALVRFFKGRNPDISEITVRNLRGFEEYITNEKVVKVDWRKGKQKTLRKEKKGRAASLYLANIRHIYKSARLEFNDPDLGLFPIPNDPFEYYSVPKIPASKHKNIVVDIIQKMIDTREDLSGRQRMAVDAFLISFGLCGMNAADLFSCAKPKKDILHYFRQKTTKRRHDRAEMWVKIHPCIKNIAEEYFDKSRCFNYYKRYANKDVFTTALNQGLRLWQKKYGIDEDFTFGSARHSWGTIGSGKLCNIQQKIITAGMCHVDEQRRVDEIYIQFDWELLWDAQKKILDVFRWK